MVLCALILSFTGCRQQKTEIEDINLVEYCSAILDATMKLKDSNLLTDECYQYLADNWHFGGVYDTTELTVHYLRYNEKYVCMCEAEYKFDSTDYTEHHTFCITFTLVEDMVTDAEVVNYEEY